MIEFGESLRRAREAKGLSRRDIADKTHMMERMVEALEREDFSRIAAPIYGRGFVKLYCEVVGLDPKPMVAAFMDIFGSDRLPSAGNAEDLPAPEPVRVPPPAADESAGTASLRADFSLDGGGAIRTADVFPDYRADVKEESSGAFGAVKPAVWRLAVVVVAAVAVVWAVVSGVMAIYNAAMTAPENESRRSGKVATEKKQPSAERLAERPARTQLEVPPLYID